MEKAELALGVAVLVSLALFGCSEDQSGSDATSQPTAVAKRALHLPTAQHGIRHCPFSAAVKLDGIPAEGVLTDSQSGKPTASAPIYVAFGGVPRLPYLLPARAAKEGAGRYKPVEALLPVLPSYKAETLVRGQRLDGSGRVKFIRDGAVSNSLEFRPAGRQKPFQAFGGKTVDPPDGWWVERTKFQLPSEGCYGLQIDGRGFSYRLVFLAIAMG